MPFRSSIPRRHPGLINYCVSFPLLCNQSPQLHNTWTLAHRSQSVWLTRFSAQGPTKLESRCARASPEAPSSSVAVADSSSSRRGIEVPFPSGRRLGALAAPGSRRCPLPRSLHHPQSQQWEITPTRHQVPVSCRLFATSEGVPCGLPFLRATSGNGIAAADPLCGGARRGVSLRSGMRPTGDRKSWGPG